jgi:hypothetical protein
MLLDDINNLYNNEISLFCNNKFLASERHCPIKGDACVDEASVDKS